MSSLSAKNKLLCFLLNLLVVSYFGLTGYGTYLAYDIPLGQNIGFLAGLSLYLVAISSVIGMLLVGLLLWARVAKFKRKLRTVAVPSAVFVFYA